MRLINSEAENGNCNAHNVSSVVLPGTLLSGQCIQKQINTQNRFLSADCAPGDLTPRERLLSESHTSNKVERENRTEIYLYLHKIT